MNNVTETLTRYVNSLPEYEIQIGVFSNKSKRKKTKNVKTKKTKSVGQTNAEIMFIQENGSPLRHIPSRPVLRMSIDYGKTLITKTIKKALDEYSKVGINGLEKELNKLCMRMENYARDVIYSNDGRLEPNAPSVIAQKGFNHPLFNTGQLARSITCKLVKL